MKGDFQVVGISDNLRVGFYADPPNSTNAVRIVMVNSDLTKCYVTMSEDEARSLMAIFIKRYPLDAIGSI